MEVFQIVLIVLMAGAFLTIIGAMCFFMVDVMKFNRRRITQTTDQTSNRTTTPKNTTSTSEYTRASEPANVGPPQEPPPAYTVPGPSREPTYETPFPQPYNGPYSCPNHYPDNYGFGHPRYCHCCPPRRQRNLSAEIGGAVLGGLVLMGLMS